MRYALAFTLGLVIGAAAMPLVRRAVRHSDNPPLAHSHRHAAFMRRAAMLSDVPAVFFGDSITALWSDVPDIWDKNFPGAVNFGVGSETATGLLWRLEHGELDGYRAGSFVLLIGVNDLKLGREPSDVAQTIDRCVSLIRERHPQATLVVLEILPTDIEGGQLRVKINETNMHLRSRIPDLVECGDLFLRNGKVDASLMPDLLHPSPAGYELLAPAISSQLD